MKNIIFYLYILLIPLMSLSQEYKRDNVWMLGEAAAPGYPQFGIDFNSGTADTFSLLRPMAFFATNSSICDTSGELLFYTNGNYVSDRRHQMMPGTAGFNPGDENTNTYPFGSGLIQGAIILPWSGHSDKYVIFHMDANNFLIGSDSYTRPLTMRYSVIDMQLDSGYGDFTNLKNEILIQDTLILGRITACKHANGRDWWIFCHELWSNQFYELLLTPDTIQFYQSQHIGSIITQRMDALGTGVFSKDGTIFAYLNQDTTLNIFDFDRCSGLLSNPVYVYFLDTLNLGTISCAFSPSGRYLYVCNNFHIFQLDMQASSIPASKIIVANYDGYRTSQGFRTIFAMMKLAPDNKIYISTYEGSNVFNVINAPDSAGIACHVTQHNFILPQFNAFSMSNVPNYALGVLAGSACDSLHNGINVIEENKSFILFPNPSSEKINIKTDENIFIYSGVFEIFSLLGNKIYSRTISNRKDLIDIDIHSLSNGIYTCHLILNNCDKVIGKLIVVH